MTSSNKENDSCSSDDEIHKVFRQNRTRSVVSPESDDENSHSGAENKSKQKKTLQKKCESDSASNGNVSPPISQANDSSKNETKPDSDHQKSPKEISDGEQSEKCAICLSRFLDQQIASPETCDHKFCSECILEWAKKMNTCPIDRLRFRYVFLQNREKPELRERVPVDEQWHRSVQAAEYIYLNTCQLCSQGENLVACIGCSRSYHAACLHMPPDQVEWHCPHCTFQERLSHTNVRMSERYRAMCRFNPRLQIPFEQRNRVMAEFFGVPADLPTRQSQFLATNENDSSSEDSSDESEGELSSSTERQQQCEAVRNRRQTRYSERMRARVLNTLSNRPALVTHNPSEPFYAPNDSSDDSDYGYQDSGGGGVVSTVPPRSVSLTQLLDRNKCFVSSTFLDYPLPALRPMPRPGEDSDIVDNFRILEDLHPRSNMDHVPLSRKENDVGRQHPGNPAQNSTSGSGNSRSTFPSSSSSSATSGSSLYGLFSTPGDSMLTSNAAAEGYDTDASPVATHHNYGNTSQQSSSKKDAQESVHVKDIQKSHSDDEVDIYSDIEYANDENSIDTDVLQLRASYKSEASSHLQSHGTADENSLDTDMMQLQSSYKSDEPHSSPVGDGTDSSDNDLVIDEDVAAEEEAKNNADKESSDISHENAGPGSENSCGSSSAENCEPSSEPNMPENIQSPDPSEDVNHESDWPANNESEESVDHVPGNKLNFEMKLYVDTDADSRDIQCADDDEDHKDEDHSQNSFESKSENQGPKSPINDNSLSPHKDDGDVVMADGDVSTDNLTEYFQETLPTEKNEDSAIEMNSDDKQVETDDLMNETNSVHKSDDSDEEEEEDCDNKAEEDEKECESDDNECVNNSSTPEYRSSPTNCLSPKGQNSADGMSSSFNSSKTFANSTTPFFTENPTTGLKEFPTKASLKECLPIEGEFETKEHREKNNNYQNIDLGIEDISDAASDDLNQLDNDTPEPAVCGDTPDATMCDVEKNVAKLFEPEDMESSPTKHNRNHRSDDYCEGASDDSKRYAASYRQDLIEDQEEGEIIEDMPYQRKNSHRRGHFIHDDEDYGDSAPRINISDLPRIPKIRRETKPDIPEEPLLETKRTSVLGRVDLGQADIGWKRLSKHTRERSYRDGRPKDETILFRERELKSRDRSKKHPSRERKNEQKPMEPERRKEDKKPNSDKSRDRSKDHSRDRRSEKSKSDHERSKSEWSYSEKRDKEKHSKHKERHDRDKTRKERHESKKDRHEKSKDKSRREDSKHRQEKLRAEDKYAREVERFHQKEESYERMYEKPREKEHKHKHKESKSDSGKKCKDEKHKRTHSHEYFFEKREREVRKVDDKLKIVVEHKESRSKDRNEKLTEKRDFKHEKKHREVGHHHERKKKELSPVSYTELTPIESKEIFAKGDSIIINVNFNRASPREVVPPGSEEFNRDKKSNSGDLIKGDSESHNSKLAHSSLDSDKKNDLKCPTTPLEKNSQLLSTDEYYWQGGDEANVKSSVEEKGSSEKARSINDESSNSPVNNFGVDDNVTDSEDEDNLPETQPNTSLLPKDDELDLIVLSPEKGSDKNQTFRESEEKEFGSSRQRSPLHPPSPPSPPDNDSYDPCEPTKSPSPPPPPVPPSPPLPPICMTSDRPKPPPSPELPPLPPEPEPTDTAFLEDGKSNAQSHSLDSVNSIRSSPVVTQPTEHHGPVTTESVASAPGTLLPPPRFLGHVSHQTVSNMQSQLTPSKTWQATNPPPSTVIFQSNHMQPVMPGNFLPAHIPTVGFPPPHVSATVLPSNSSIPLTSQVRHMQLGPHSVVPTNTLLSNVPMNHMTLPQVQISHVNPPLPNPSVSAAMHQQHHPVIAMQAHAGNLPNSMASHISGIMPIQNQLASNATVTLHGQHGNLISAHHPQSVTQLYPPQNHQTLPQTSLKEKLPKSSPAKDRSEVIDMDVDSPYSPGDSPSMDSAYDYSPPSSPVYQDNNPVAAVKDAFDSLFTAEQASGSQVEKTSSKSHSHSNSGEREHKKQKLDSKTESSKSRHHSVRLQVVDKVKSRKEHKLSERKDVLTKLDDSQLTILDELPSSAVEMQVKEKFLKKLNRQERVVEEVKLALKPYYKTREVSKEEYKDILRKSVPKICHNKSGEINPQKVKYFVDCYVKKMKHHRKKASKKRKSSKFS